MSSIEECPERYRVLIGNLPDDWSGETIRAPSPTTGQNLLYLLLNSGLAEVVCHDRHFGSWFAEDLVVGDSTMYVAVPVDSAFFLLPILVQSQASIGDVFQGWQQIIETSWVNKYGNLSKHLEQSLGALCDCRSVETDKYYKLNADRVLAWLRCKVCSVVAGLKELGETYTCMDDSHLESYAVGLLSEYLSSQWNSRLRAAFGIPEPDSQQAVQPLTDHNFSNSQEQGRKAAKIQKVDPKAIARKKAQEAAAEKRAQQQKRQSAGMKKIGSFFTKTKS